MSEIDEHIIKRYEIKKRLGKGAYGVVWKALDRKTKHVVAVKKIYDAFRNQTDAQRTFREIMFLQEFGAHPNIIKLLGIHRACNNKDIYLIFEYMDTDLHNIIKHGNILKDVHKRFIMYQLLKATKYIHSGNVIHRDQKPSNILLDSDCHCKIADFGLARSITQIEDGSGEGLSDPQLTDYVATRWYRAPEILLACKRYTPGIDMWSLGCILAEMLLGKPLFPGSSTVNQMERIMSALPPPSAEDLKTVFAGFGSTLLERPPQGPHKKLTEILQDASEDAIDLVSRLLLFNPNKRLTAEQALEHPYVRRFHDKALEPSMSYKVLPPLRDDIQLAVDDYRNKLYELMGRSKVKNKKSIRHLAPILTHPAKHNRDCNRAQHVFVNESSNKSRLVSSNSSANSPLTWQHAKFQERAPGLQTIEHCKKQQYVKQVQSTKVQVSNCSLKTTNLSDESNTRGKQFHAHFKTYPASLNKKLVQSTKKTIEVEQIKNKSLCNNVSDLSSYIQSHGIVTQSALMQLRPTIHW